MCGELQDPALFPRGRKHRTERTGSSVDPSTSFDNRSALEVQDMSGNCCEQNHVSWHF